MRDRKNYKKAKYNINCPYCWAKNEIEVERGYEIIWPHPPNFGEPYKNNKPRTYFWAFWSIYCFIHRDRIITKEYLKVCHKCGHKFHIHADLSNYEENPRYTDSQKYYISLLLGKNKKIERKPFLENILDGFCNLLRIKYPIGCFLFILMPCIIFWILPIIAVGGFSKLSHDYSFVFIFILFVLMFILLKRHCNILRNCLNCEQLPFLIHEKYRKSIQCKILEEWTFRGNIFGHPFQKITPPTVCGLVAATVFIIWQINYIINIANTFYETPYEGSYPFVYTSYIHAIACIPFWALIYFIIGNITWIFMATVSLVGLMTRHIPLKIDPMKDMGGTEILGKMLLSSLYPFAILGGGIPIAIFWSSQKVSLFVVCVFFILCFMFLIAFGFFYPLWPIHRELKKKKEKEQNEILSKLSLSKIKDGMDLKDTIYTQLLLDTYSKISMMREWPFRVDTLIKACSAILFPFISLLINGIIFLLKA